MSLFQGFAQLGAGLAVGLAGLAAGFAIGIVGDAGVRGTAQQPRLFVGMVRLHQLCQGSGLTRVGQILILIFAEVLGLYGTYRFDAPFQVALNLPTIRAHRCVNYELGWNSWREYRECHSYSTSF